MRTATSLLAFVLGANWAGARLPDDSFASNLPRTPPTAGFAETAGVRSPEGIHPVIALRGTRVLTAVEPPGSGPPTRVGQAATVEYRYDDGGFERGTRIDTVSQEYAQLFRLNQAGAIAGMTVCWQRHEASTSSGAKFQLRIYVEGTLTGRWNFDWPEALPRAGHWRCAKMLGSFIGSELPAGNIHVAFRWNRATPEVNTLLMTEDHDGPGGTRVTYRSLSEEDGEWSDWSDHPVARAIGIRLTVDHADGTPDPPPPPTVADCEPTRAALHFDGGYRVSMCWRTREGREGQARSGIWASGQAGLLWFFDPDNAEVLIKVLNGCSHNGHRWVYVAPVTDVHFNLWVSGPNGRRWTYKNKLGRTAATRSDTAAFPCN